MLSCSYLRSWLGKQTVTGLEVALFLSSPMSVGSALWCDTLASPKWKWSDIFLSVSLDCDSTCVGCTGKGPANCKECIAGYTKESGQCTGQ